MADIISLFSGCGGLDLGFEQVGDYRTVWANDFKHEACVTFRNNFGNVIVEGDIEQIDPYHDANIPNCDLVLGGFPCQDFSIIWKQPGLNGERGNLYKSFLRFVDAKKPKAFVAENVKGILTANGKKAIKQIIEDFQNIEPGYIVKPHLYNFAEYDCWRS
jgi:DNA (cytosine-5-)-methyltransferase